MAAVVTDCDGAGNAALSLRNKFRTGDRVELVGPGLRPFSLTVPEMKDGDGLPLFEPRTPRSVFYMKLPRQVPPWTIVRRAADLSAKGSG